MSRIGNTPISVPSGVELAVRGDSVAVKGAKGNLEFAVPPGITVTVSGSTVKVQHKTPAQGSALHGLVRAQIANMVKGVSEGWTKTLELVGVGYRATLNGTTLVLNVGFSHPVNIEPPAGITFTIKEGKIVVSGTDKQAVGEIAAKIREVKKPEPYKGKGIRYAGEYIRKKAGKAKAVGGSVGK
ncbi:50S ribosomal protein L6 [Candidatus Gottesmanbacteria bacterium RBG_16_52_11]|uniref:Large ribosomal subunit protein uL6 n=1 Tax=Candidatus Gottesmanbacteria bacterium RBG_16_52_11 TaxID=1798374 RepID=A0A1F5YXZ2_9BACT|nr:MAG: 50S ribosomal protein L6 [Candidatus Gottesmanbacteria bacterium RBG_16_52_11]